MVAKQGHVYFECILTIMYTEEEIGHIHRHLYHLQTDRLFTLLRRAGSDSVSLEFSSDLEKIRATYDVRQCKTNSSHRIRVSLPDDDCVFNRVVSSDLMASEKRTMFHVVDRYRKFTLVCFLLG